MTWTKHESTFVDEGAQIGDGSKIWHFGHISGGARIGAGCSLGQNVYVASTAVIGDGVRIQNNVSIYDGVTIENDAFIGPSAVFTNVINPRSEVARKDEYLQTHVGQGASIGANATIVCGSKLGNYAFVGAGAVVTRDVKPYALVVGVPAQQVGWICRCGVGLEGEGAITCRACQRRYSLDGEDLKEA